MVESATLHIPLAGKGGWDRLLNGDKVTSVDLQLDSTGVAFMFACFLCSMARKVSSVVVGAARMWKCTRQAQLPLVHVLPADRALACG